jgi:hypothetical protein
VRLPRARDRDSGGGVRAGLQCGVQLQRLAWSSMARPPLPPITARLTILFRCQSYCRPRYDSESASCLDSATDQSYPLDSRLAAPSKPVCATANPARSRASRPRSPTSPFQFRVRKAAPRQLDSSTAQQLNSSPAPARTKLKFLERNPPAHSTRHRGHRLSHAVLFAAQGQRRPSRHRETPPCPPLCGSRDRQTVTSWWAIRAYQRHWYVAHRPYALPQHEVDTFGALSAFVCYLNANSKQPRIEGKVEIRPLVGVSAPVLVSLVTISLQRRETIHPAADSVTKKHLAAPRKEITDIVGKEMLLFRCHAGKEFEKVLSMDLPFVIFIPYGRGGEETARRVPPASLQLPSRTAETFYELVVTVQQGQTDQRKYPFPVPMQRYDTLSTFGMYNRPESAERVTDHLVTLGISLPRWSYGPLDPVSVYIQLNPNPDWLSKAKKVTISKITVGIDEEIIFNHEGDEPSRKVRTLAKTTQAVGVKMPEAGYFTNLGLVFPAKDLRDSEGVIPRGKKEFPMYAVSGFTTTGTLYKIEYYLTVKVSC